MSSLIFGEFNVEYKYIVYNTSKFHRHVIQLLQDLIINFII